MNYEIEKHRILLKNYSITEKNTLSKEEEK